MLRSIVLASTLFAATLTQAEEAAHLSDTLSTADRVAVEIALDEAHKAISTHAKVLLDHPKAKGFIEAMESEKRNAAMLGELLETYGESVPASRWAGRVRAPASLLDACESAAAAEVEQQASHERALRATRPEPLRSAFEALLTASRERTPAFTQCAEKLAKKEAKQR